ncbi:TonB-dependent receptor [Candidatus Reidiella endopervernicosa]|uniref:TonB-dependent receptor n=1 Tax=Candidatus Reidiella endopervernicosa TaxID=2738883 RepID=A0A6N0HXG8_9GAMM|nr:TonB-dependent receptor [Candidatus Reidiella endopervernicosa]
MSVIDEEMIIASGARTIPELFRLVPGFQVMYSNTTNMGVTSHGLSEHVSKRMQVLINGRSVYLPTTGGVPWSNLPITIEDIKRIEVVRGPNAATYGANAYLGVINIITKHSVEDLGTSFKLTGGYNEHRKIDIRHGNSLGDIDYRIGFSALTEEGFIERHDGQEQGILTGRFDYQVTANDSLFLEAGLNQSYKKDGHVDSSLNPPHMQNGDYNFQLMRWEHSNDANNQFSLQLSHQYYELDDNYRAIANVSGMDVFSNIDFDYSGRRYAAEFQHNFTLGNSVKALWGLGAREDSVNSVGYLGTDATLENTLLRAYANPGSRYFCESLFWASKPKQTAKLNATVYAFGAPTVLRTLRNHLFAALHNSLSDSTPT